MSQQCLRALLLAWLSFTSASKGVHNSGLAVQVFSSLQDSPSGDSLPPYPEGIELGLSCQAAARTTFWYERHSPDASPDPVKDKLEYRSSDPVPGVSLSVFTITHLKKEDDGRELWCTMDGSSIKKVVKLNVVGPSNVSATTRYNASSNDVELLCSSDSLHPELELCWYRGEDLLRCQVPHEKQTPATVRVNCSEAGKQEDGALLQCKPRLKDQKVMGALTKQAQDRFNEMFTNATKKLDLNLTDVNRCKEILQSTIPSTLANISASGLQPTNETDRSKTTTPQNETTTTTATTLWPLTSPTTIPSNTSELRTTLTPSTTVTTSTVNHPSATPSPTAGSQPKTPTPTRTLMMITVALLLGLFFTSFTSAILCVKLRLSRTSVQNVYNDSQSAPNGSQSGSAQSGDGRGQVGNVPRWTDGRPDGISHCFVRVDDLASGQSGPGVEYPGAVDASDHRWPGEGVPLDHAYYYPDITEQVKKEILNGNRRSTNGLSRGGADRPVASTGPCNAVNHSYHYPVLTEEMKKLLSTNIEQGSHPTTEGGGGASQ